MGAVRSCRGEGRSVVVESMEARTLMSVADPAVPVLLTHITNHGSYTGSLYRGTPFTLNVRGGDADVYRVDNRLQLVVTDAGRGVGITLVGNYVTADVTVTGNLKSFNAPTVSVAGNMLVKGSVGTVLLNSISGTFAATGAISKLAVGAGVSGTIVAGGTIGALSVGALNGAIIVSGTNVGADGKLGGGDDTYGPGGIASLRMSGPAIGATVAVGVNPGADGVYGTTDDAAGAGGSIKGMFLVDGADANTHFEARSFGTIRMPKKLVNPASDARFRVI